MVKEFIAQVEGCLETALELSEIVETTAFMGSVGMLLESQYQDENFTMHRLYFAVFYKVTDEGLTWAQTRHLEERAYFSGYFEDFSEQ